MLVLATGAAGVLLAAGLTAASGGRAGARLASPETLSQLTIGKTADVTVSELPAATALSGSVQKVPFRSPNPAAYAAAKQQLNSVATSAGGLGGTSKPTITKGPLLPQALTFADSGGWTPPDMGLAVGGGFKMELVNTVLRIWDKNNNPGSLVTLDSFFNAGSDFVFDPWALFDQPSGRYFVGAMNGTKATEVLAVSATSDPTGVWHIYNIPHGGCPDYGKGGVSDKVFALGENQFSSGCGSFLGPVLTVLNKAELLAGASNVHIAQSKPLSQYSNQVTPAQSMNSTTNQWFVGFDDASSIVAHVIKAKGTPPAKVKITEPFTPTIRTLATPPGAQQKGSSALLDTLDNRVFTVAWQSNSVIATADNACVPKHDTTTRSCARLLAVDTTNGHVTIDKDAAKKGQYFFFPAARPNPGGSIVFGYGHSSSTLYPELAALASDPTGAFSKSIVVQAGSAPNTTGRYGDYFSVAIDPQDPHNAWIAGEIGQDTWGTAVGQVTVTP